MSTSRFAYRLAGPGIGILADELFGEPPLQPHPVAAFGSAMRTVERALYRDHRAPGVLHAVIGAGIGAGTGAALGSTAIATYLAVAGRALREAADAVARPLRSGDIEEARRLLPALVGRDPSELDAAEIARAVVESLAENTVDAVVAPVVWAVIGGGIGVLAYRAVNTMDAMVGHRSARYERYGWAAARLDDAANLVPARVTAGLVGCVRPRRARAVRLAVRTQAGAHPSPNAGVAEAAFAAALDVRLGGTNTYAGRTEVRPRLGTDRAPGPEDIAAAARLSRDVGLVLAVSLAAAATAVRTCS